MAVETSWPLISKDFEPLEVSLAYDSVDVSGGEDSAAVDEPAGAEQLDYARHRCKPNKASAKEIDGHIIRRSIVLREKGSECYYEIKTIGMTLQTSDLVEMNER